MAKKIQTLVLLSIILMMSLACSLSQVSRLFGEYPQNPGDLLFQDGFSDPSSGWDRVQSEEGMTDYENDRYRIVVNAANADYWTNPGLSFKDVMVDVDAGKNAGPDDNDFGILCRYQDTENFYFLIISSDGYYGIGIVQDGEQRLLEPPQMYQSDSVIPGDAANHLQAICHGSRLTLYVNGDLVAEAIDSTFTEGDIGLIVGSFDEPGVDIWFDNLMIRNP
ncbi:MAG: family 16 glycoside hydrolase [Anaerolineales bacterium]